MENRYYAQSYEGVRSFLYKVFGWMSFALAVSGITAYFIGTSEVLHRAIMGNTGIVIGLAIVQLILVVVLSGIVQSLSQGMAFTLFALYSVLTGMTLSSIFVLYTTMSIASVFFIAAGMFGAMALYGAFTKTDLSRMGTFLMLALFGMIIAMVVNIFLRSAGLNLAVAFIGVFVFAAFTAYDLQRIKQLAQQIDVHGEGASNLAISAALALYLDFINLFISLLQLFGDRKQ